MKRLAFAFFPFFVAASAVVLLSARMAGLPGTPGAGAGPVPVVVELFTSEGCSSCPAADAALRELETSQAAPGIEVIALGQHVDYWNRLGWKDPYSAAAFTERQRGYATGFGTGSYTPQAVVNGRYELVGSQRTALVAAVRQAAQAPRATVTLARTATGAIAGTDGPLTYASGTPATPGIGAVAYTNSFPGAASTTLYAFDELNTAAPGNPANTALLSIVSPPNNGTLTAPVPVMFGAFVTGAPAAIDMDIYANGTTNRNEAFLMEVTAMGSSNFYRLNLTTGQATLVGNTVPRVIPFALRDIAVGIGLPLATAPAALAQLATLAPNPARGAATLRLPAALRGTQTTAVAVTDNLGRVVLRRTLAAGPADALELPLTGLAPGVYSVLAQTAAGLVARRLVVQ